MQWNNFWIKIKKKSKLVKTSFRNWNKNIYNKIVAPCFDSLVIR